MKTMARGSFIVFFLLSTLGCALLYAGVFVAGEMNHGACLFSMERIPCIQQGDLMNFAETHFAVFSKIQGAIALGAFLLAMALVASRGQKKGEFSPAMFAWRLPGAAPVEFPIENRFLRWLSLLEKRSPGEMFA